MTSKLGQPDSQLASEQLGQPTPPAQPGTGPLSSSALGQTNNSRLGSLRLGQSASATAIPLPESDTARLHLVERATKASVSTSKGRLTQAAVEVLTGPGSPRARLTQSAVEVLTGPGSPNARLSQAAVEVLIRRTVKSPADTANLHLGENASLLIVGGAVVPFSAADTARIHLVETAVGGVAANARLTQAAVEVLAGPGSPYARLSQAAVEVLAGPGSPKARLSQAALEVLVRRLHISAGGNYVSGAFPSGVGNFVY